MQITEIKKAKGNRYTVYVDGEYFYILDAEILAEYGLREGRECDRQLLDEVLLCAQRKKAFSRALYLLEYRDHAFAELVDKLEKSVDAEVALETANRMVELGFLDDRKYCRRLAQSYLTTKMYGARRTRFELSKKGFSRELIDETLADCAETVDTAAVLDALIERKYKRYLTDRRGFKKVTDALMRLGHSYSDIQAALSAYTDDELE